MASGVTVTGARDLIANLNRLNVVMKTQIVADAVQAGGNVMRSGMQARALRFRKSGALNSKFEVVVSVANGRGEARVGPSRDTFYGGIIQSGAKPHPIKVFVSARSARRGGRAKKKALSDGSRIFQSKGQPRGVVLHPGFPARPFMTETVQQDAPRVLAAMADVVRAGIDRASAEGYRR